jgi:hypothetical protein
MPLTVRAINPAIIILANRLMGPPLRRGPSRFQSPRSLVVDPLYFIMTIAFAQAGQRQLFDALMLVNASLSR